MCLLPSCWYKFSRINNGVTTFMFLIYINFIVETLNCNVRLFADDTSLYVIVENPITAGNILNSNLSGMHAWSEQWLVNFNPSKTESLILRENVIKQYIPYSRNRSPPLRNNFFK